MAQEVTLGGDRLGSGQKQTVELHNYGMTSFNLEQDFKSSMAPGVLYPFIKMVGTNHGTFDIDLDTLVRTIPTKGPLFGSFKLQADIFCVPFRLYQGILHNNPISLGLNMDKVKLPKLRISTKDWKDAPRVKGSTDYNCQVNESALMKYLGLSGIGRSGNQLSDNSVTRKINAIPAIAYYDIFKTYYANKQEENAYVITPEDEPEQETADVVRMAYAYWDNDDIQHVIWENELVNGVNIYWNETASYQLEFVFWMKEKRTDLITIKNSDTYDKITLKEAIDQGILNTIEEGKVDSLTYPQYNGYYWIRVRNNGNTIQTYMEDLENNEYSLFLEDTENAIYTSGIKLRPFALANIDDMRNFLLSNNTLNTEVQIIGFENEGRNYWDINSGHDETGLPYTALVKTTTEGITWNAFEMNGLCVKTYQSDLFNNWLNSEYIDGENGISAISSVAVVNNSFTMDSLNMAEKIYEYLNRVLVSGGTYEDWQEATYGQGAVRKAETPMYVGGMAAEVGFEEVISTAETNVDDNKQALGSLGGRGANYKERGGKNIHVKCEEPCYIIGIVSLTPRICYSQGNDWDLTELDTIDDLHKPALDGIGYQDLIVEQMAWWDTVITPGGTTILHRNSAGKQTAWINYQTAVDKCYGDFAKSDGYAFMVLNRNYEIGDTVGSVKDLTTYIDPSKFNYAFAYSELAAQNFWVQIHSRVIARRKMGAQQIPNL